MKKKYTLGIVGVRGYVGRELLALLMSKTEIELEWVSSRQLKGKPLCALLTSDDNFKFEPTSNDHYFRKITIDELSPENVANKNTDIVILALPNGLAEPYVSELERNSNCQLVIDLSADYRFDKKWNYSIPELTDLNQFSKGSLTKISNPGCYATAMQLAIAPLFSDITGSVNCFGISGYSGAGTSPCENNDPIKLKNNILPYSLLGHIHEKEVSHQMGLPVRFSPHVAEFFRGISMTVQLELEHSWKLSEIIQIFETFYKNYPLVKISESIPNIQQVINTNYCMIGGFKLSEGGRQLSLVSCLDNLLKGAASQALQNIYLALNIEF